MTAFLALASLPLTAAAVHAGSHTVSLVSQNDQGAAGNHVSSIGAVSADGRYLAFVSQAANLVAGDTNSIADVFVRDMVAGTTARVNVSSTGAQADGPLHASSTIAISSDGQRVAFASLAANLVPGDTNTAADVFVHDRTDGSTRRVSVGTGGVQTNAHSHRPAISGNGRYVAFVSDAEMLVPDDSNAHTDVFLHDLVTGRTERVSVGSSGQQGNLSSDSEITISGDGRFVAFGSRSTNLAPGDGNASMDVFLRDRANGVTELVSANALGFPANRGGFGPDVSDDGRYVSFVSTATDLAAPDELVTADLFLRDRSSGTTARINVDANGLPSPAVRAATIAGDGRFVAFWFEWPPVGQVWLYDQLVGHTQPVNVNLNGAQNNNASGAAISADGRWVGFSSTDLYFDASDTNAGLRDAFVWDRWSLPRTICAADDHLMVACPCVAPNTVPAPQAAPDHGCANSMNAGGAVLHGEGSLVPDELRFRAEIAPLYGGFAFLIRGDASNADGLGAGDGIRCITGNLVRFGSHMAGTNGDALGEWTYPNAVQTTPVSVVTAQRIASSAYYQVVYRDVAASFCNPSTFNVTSGLAVGWP
ncbi:MAG: hypothetical protein ACKVWV_14740 [Planctomycetota bacterium]